MNNAYSFLPTQLAKIKRKYHFLFLLFSVLIILVSCNNALKSVRNQYAQRFCENLPFENSQFVTINNSSIHYRIWKQKGSMKGKILMVHGLTGSTFSWRNQIDALTNEGYFLVAVDMPPFGYSDKKKNVDYSLQNNTHIFWKFLDMIDTTEFRERRSEPWILMSHSMGGRVVCNMTLQCPQRVNALIMVDPAIEKVNNKNAITWIPGMGWVVRGFMKYAAFKPASIKMYATQAYGREPQENEIRGYIAPLMEKYAVRSLTKWATSRKKDVNLDVRKIKQPVLLIWGKEDSYSPICDGYKLDSLIPDSKLFIIPVSAHCPNETHYLQCNEEMLKFLKR